MRPIAIALLALVLALPVEADDELGPALVATATIEVEGMSCPNGCPPSVAEAIEEAGGRDCQVSFERKEAVFAFDPRRTDLDAVRQGLLEGGFQMRLGRPITVVHRGEGLSIEVTTSAPSVAVGGEATIDVSISTPDGALPAGLTIATTGPANAEGLPDGPVALDGAEHHQTFRVTRRARPRFLVFEVQVAAEGLEPIVVPIPIGFDR